MFTKIYINIRNHTEIFEERTYAGSEMFSTRDRKRMILPKKYSGRGIDVENVFRKSERRDTIEETSHYSDSFSEDEMDPEVYENVHQK